MAEVARLLDGDQDSGDEATLHPDDTTMIADESVASVPPSHTVKEANPTGNNWSIVMDLDSGPGTLPGFYISQGESQPRPPNRSDIISRGIITLEAAQRYFDEYKNRLDSFPYLILGDIKTYTLEYVRSASPLLVAAVCTIGSLHLVSPDFDACCAAFLSQSASQTFAKDFSVDDVRALCIGAFWLGEVAWTLVSAAVRMATELQLHKSFFRALQGDRKAYLNARLYYVVYVCDHHYSIPFGRPPLTRQCEAVRSVRRFLEFPGSTQDDARLVSHVLRWSVLSDAVDSFGVDVNRPLGDEDLPALRRYNIAMDSLRAEWMERFTPHPLVGNYPRKGVALQYHFSRLYLCSHAFRGGAGRAARNGGTQSSEVMMELDEVADGAVRSAMSILRSVSADEEMQSFFDGLPIYFGTMVAFTIVFLLKVSTKYSSLVRVNRSEIYPLMEDTVTALEKVTSKMHRRHLLVSITKGMRSLVKKMRLEEGPGLVPSSTVGSSSTQAPQDPTLSVAAGEDEIMGLLGTPANNFFMGTYDFLVDQADFSDFFVN